ncbi:MAG TPA: hypothetical protein VEV37_09750 [Bryobacteraceae bacterium]|nr:hypothetical protein [Bryobacteraceae bacterium]
MLTRRDLGRVLLGALAVTKIPRRASAGVVPRLCVDRLLAGAGLPLPDPVTRRYRADVVVTLLGVPIFSRKNVGGAFAAIRETGEGSRKLVAIRFAGGANPQRTHGFKYDGSLEEAVLEDGSQAVQAAYFGFVTSSTNESYDQARQRIFAAQKSRDTFTAAEGQHVPGSARCEKSSISLPDGPAHDVAGLNEQIRARFAESDRAAAELHTSGAATTFLYSVRTAVRAPEPRSTVNYVYNAKPYRLECERSPEPHNGAGTRFTGKIHDLATRQVSTFHLWMEDPSGLPRRIEFQPRSYLRISLEYEPVGANRTEES